MPVSGFLPPCEGRSLAAGSSQPPPTHPSCYNVHKTVLPTAKASNAQEMNGLTPRLCHWAVMCPQTVKLDKTAAGESCACHYDNAPRFLHT